MVFSVPFRCDICNTIFNLKIQADNSLYFYDYPISLECPECGETIEMTYAKKKGLLPKIYAASTDCKPNYDFYYSASLPIPDVLHLKPSEKIMLSPFLLLGQNYTSPMISQHNVTLNLFLENVCPYKKVFKALLPIYRKGNVLAFSKKWAKIFDIHQGYTPIKDIKLCRTGLFDLLQQTYNNIATEEYLTQIANPFLLGVLDIDNIVRLKDSYKATLSILNYNQWQKVAFDFVGDNVAKFEKYLPSLFFCSIGDFSDKHAPETNIFTIGAEEVVNDFDTSFNLIKELLPLIVAFTNYRVNGDINVFPEKVSSMKGVTGIKAFHELPDGLKSDKLQNYTEITNYLAGGFNHKIRNGIGHDRWELTDDTQKIQFKYKQNVNDEHYDIQLIDLGYLVIINLLHIMEFILLIEKLKK